MHSFDAGLQPGACCCATKEKDKLFKKYIAKKSTLAKAKYKEARNKYFHRIQQKKEAFFASILEKQKHNIKKTWQTINILLGKTKNHSYTSLRIHGELSTNDAKTADRFNKHFTTIGGNLMKDMNHAGAKFDDYLGSSYPHCMYVNPTCVSEIKNILSGMQSKNSCGLDEIPMSILKLSPDNILLILCHILNLYWDKVNLLMSSKRSK